MNTSDSAEMLITTQKAAYTLAALLSKSKWPDWILMACLFVFAVIIGLAATASGPGVTPDSATYISQAVNIYKGRGFVTNLSGPFDSQIYLPVVLWPPGYSLMATALMSVGATSLEAARLVPILSLAFLVCAMYWMGRILGGHLVAVLCAITTLASMPVVRVASFAVSEAPFMLVSMLILIVMVQYATVDSKREPKWLILGGLFTAMSIYIRYIGMAWVVFGLLIIGYKFLIAKRAERGTRSWLLAGLSGLGFGLIACLPIVPWLVRNQQITGYLTGFNRSEGYHATLSDNLRYLFGTVFGELIPSIHLGLRSSQVGFIGIGLFVIVLGITGVLLGRRTLHTKHHFAETRTSVKDWLTNERLQMWLVSATFVAVYVMALVVLSTVQQYPPYDWPRYLVVIYPVIFLFMISVLAAIVTMLFAKRPGPIQWMAILLPALLWIVPYSIQTAGFVSNAAQGQELTTQQWRHNEGIGFLTRVVAENDIIYSDRADAVSFLLEHPTKFLPYKSDLDQFAQFIDATPVTLGVNRYIIVFKGELGQPDPYFRQRLAASDIAMLATEHSSLRQLADFADATIYQFRPVPITSR